MTIWSTAAIDDCVSAQNKDKSHFWGDLTKRMKNKNYFILYFAI